jgi:predicted secreted hydrolase
MNKKIVTIFIVFVAILTIVAFWLRQEYKANYNFKFSNPATQLTYKSDQGFLKAIDKRKFTFPADHGAHHGFKTEWWYLTGNLENQENRHFGYQVTIFRNALRADHQDFIKYRDSDWQSDNIYMAHFAVSDIEGGKFYNTESFQRNSLNLAGVRTKPFKVWLNQNYIKSVDKNFYPLEVNFKAEEIAIKLKLAEGKEPVLQGDAGLSQKSAGVGNASYYYSLTRLPTSGTVKIADEEFKVTGSSWFDREWSTSSLGEDQAGWDWFALQLDNGMELMYYQLRSKTNGVDENSAGVIVSEKGKKTKFNYQEISLKVLAKYKSKYSSATYPAKWRIKIPKLKLNLVVEPFMKDQEHKNKYPYYEGAVSVKGKLAKQKLAGTGYVELVGY